MMLMPVPKTTAFEIAEGETPSCEGSLEETPAEIIAAPGLPQGPAQRRPRPPRVRKRGDKSPMKHETEPSSSPVSRVQSTTKWGRVPRLVLP